jgi:hypothetical protein
MLRSAGFVDVTVDMKEESKDFIKDWLPGSGCENYVVSAQIVAFKPRDGQEVEAFEAPEESAG